MQDTWSDREAPTDDPLGECVYCTRLIGADPSLVLHGGGNSSVKADRPDITGGTVETLFVKGSGWDMATIETPGFTPLRLDRVRDLLTLQELNDEDMMRELLAARLDPAAPSPSVETLLHAFLPHRAVQHSHADVIVTLTNLANGEDVVRDVYGDSVVVVPYVMPGFDLATVVRDAWPEQVHDGTLGMVLLNHGLFTFADDSREAYRRHVDLIGKAEAWLDRNAPPSRDQGPPLEEPLLQDLAGLRRALSRTAGRPMVVRRHADPDVARFVARTDLDDLSQRGPLTPDHVIRTKRVPLVGRDVDGYAEAYRDYVGRHLGRAHEAITPLDPAPRIVLDPDWGMLTAGPTARDAAIAADIYHHTIPVLERSEDHLGGYRALAEHDLFDVEYWDLEQAKLRRAGSPAEFGGQVALVTGAASGIGHACAAALLDRGACVTGIDVSPSVVDAFAGDGWLGVQADVTDPGQLQVALRAGVERYGGVDIAVIAAGMFGAAQPVAEITAEEWRRVMALNVDAVASLLTMLHPLMVRSPVAGRVVVIASKNVPAPGPGAPAYSASKAAVTQLARVTALEWASDGVRVNMVHPDAVFDTGLWTEEIIADRAARYGVSVEDYRRRNLLGMEISAAQVARTVMALCGEEFAATTGAQIPVDGGSDRVI
jgi:rhamnose utilization protein RhaD (predicted bifunctional aldolase and dehydrogenase)/NAD(P)-dependent dehydrogenase (short-subunit alcohol dehydrogenase family)